MQKARDFSFTALHHICNFLGNSFNDLTPNLGYAGAKCASRFNPHRKGQHWPSRLMHPVVLFLLDRLCTLSLFTGDTTTAIGYARGFLAAWEICPFPGNAKLRQDLFGNATPYSLLVCRDSGFVPLRREAEGRNLHYPLDSLLGSESAQNSSVSVWIRTAAQFNCYHPGFRLECNLSLIKVDSLKLLPAPELMVTSPSYHTYYHFFFLFILINELPSCL